MMNILPLRTECEGRAARNRKDRARLRALIFDVDGTLADTEETHRQAFDYAFLALDLGWAWPKPLYGELLQTSGGRERIERFIDMLPLPQDEKLRLAALAPAIHREKTRLYTELVADGRCPLRPGVVRLIREARSAGMLLAIASTTSAQNVDALLARHLGPGAMRMFDAVACGDHVQRKKPAPDIYHLALAMLGLPAAACVAFEDSSNGVCAAKAAGLLTIVTPSSWTTGERFPRADLELPHLGDESIPLPDDIALALGAKWLDLAVLRRIHGSASY